MLNTTHCHSGGPGKRNEIQPEDSPLLCQVVVALSCVLVGLEERLLGNTFHTFQWLILISILRHLSSNSIRNHTLWFFILVSLALGKLLWSVTAQTGLLGMLIPWGFSLAFILFLNLYVSWVSGNVPVSKGAISGLKRTLGFLEFGDCEILDVSIGNQVYVPCNNSSLIITTDSFFTFYG